VSVKEVRPNETSNDSPLKEKKTRDIGSVGLEELVAKVQQKIEQKVEKVTTEKGSAAELEKKGDTPELKKQYFNKVGVERNMDTTAARALRGNMASTGAGPDARNLKTVVLPKLEKMADPTEVAAFGGKTNMQAPFKMDLSDLLGRTMSEIEAKPQKFQRRLSKLEERAKVREQRFGKKIPPNDEDPNDFVEEEYNRKKKSKAVAKMFEYLNKALGQKMDSTGAPAELTEPPKNATLDDDDDDGL
jgi:hypothetical protein